MTPEIVLRKVGGNDTEFCPGCFRNVVETDGSWQAFLADGDPTAPLCGVCIQKLDERVRVALDVLNLVPGPSPEYAEPPSQINDDPGAPF